MLDQVTNIDSAFLTPDLLVIILVLAGVLAYSLTIGKENGVTMIQALYMAAFPFFFVPDVFKLLPTIGTESYITNSIYFVILWFIVFFILVRNGFFESPMVPSKWEVSVFGFLFTGLFLAIIGSFLPGDVIEGFSTIVQSVFFGDALLAFWALAPVGFWVLIKGD